MVKYVTFISGNINPNYIADIFMRKYYGIYQSIFLYTEKIKDEEKRFEKHVGVYSSGYLVSYQNKDIIVKELFDILDEDDSYVFNVTCGTKDQILALNHVFNNYSGNNMKMYIDSKLKKIYYKRNVDKKNEYGNFDFWDLRSDMIKTKDIISLQYGENKSNNNYIKDWVIFSKEIFDYLFCGSDADKKHKEYAKQTKSIDEKRIDEANSNIEPLNNFLNEIKKNKINGKAKSKAYNFVRGIYFEYYLFNYVFLELKKEKVIDEVMWSIEGKSGNKADFEIDFILRNGFETYAISVTTDSGNHYRNKIYEIKNRAIKLLGDETKIALISYAKNSEQDKKFDSVLKHFGYFSLIKIKEKLTTWINGGIDESINNNSGI